MTPASHTPGPWKWARTDGGWEIRMATALKHRGIYHAIHRIEFDPGIYFGEKGYWEAQANVRLIASAPDMLAALEQAARWLRNGDYDTRGGLIEMSRLATVCETAIAKTKGGA